MSPTHRAGLFLYNLNHNKAQKLTKIVLTYNLNPKYGNILTKIVNPEGNWFFGQLHKKNFLEDDGWKIVN
jgi:hypothetical protein